MATDDSELEFEEEDARSLLKSNQVFGLMSKTLIVDGVPKKGIDPSQLNTDMDEWITAHCKETLTEFHKFFRGYVNNLSVVWS